MPGGTHLYLDAPELSRLQMASAPSPSLIPIIIDGRCVGHLLNRGCMGVEVFDAAELSIGVFPSAPDAVDTLLAEPSSRRRQHERGHPSISERKGAPGARAGAGDVGGVLRRVVAGSHGWLHPTWESAVEDAFAYAAAYGPGCHPD